MNVHWWFYLATGVLGLVAAVGAVFDLALFRSLVSLLLSLICLFDVWAWRQKDLPWGSGSRLVDAVDVLAVLSGSGAVGASTIAAYSGRDLTVVLWFCAMYLILCGTYWAVMPKLAPDLLQRIAVAWHILRPNATAKCYTRLLAVCTAVVLGFLCAVYSGIADPLSHVTWWAFVGALAVYLIGYVVVASPWRLLAPSDRYDCFISYSSADFPFAMSLCRFLDGVGLRVWWDAKDLKYGKGVTEQLIKAIASSRRVVLVMSQASLRSRWVRLEARCVITDPDVLLPIRLVDMEVIQEWRSNYGPRGGLTNLVGKLFIPDFRGVCWSTEDHRATKLIGQIRPTDTTCASRKCRPEGQMLRGGSGLSRFPWTSTGVGSPRGGTDNGQKR